MGSTQSTTATSSASTTEKNYADIAKELENAEAFVSDGVTTNLKTLGDILSDYNKNDTQGILDKLKNMDEFKGQIPDVLLNKVNEVHMSVINNLDSSLTESDKKQQIETDQNLAAYIQRFVDKDLDVKMKEYLQNPFIQGDPVVARSMADVTNSIKTIRGKYKYFEYKYVQMNIFLIMFTKHIHEVIKRFIDDTATFYAAKEKYHLVLIQNVIKTFQEQLGDETKKMTELNTTDFTSSINALTQNIMSTISEQKQIAEKMKTESLAEILRYLMQRETEFAKEIIKGVDDYKEKSPQLNKIKWDESTFKESSNPFSGRPKPESPYDVFATVKGKKGWYKLSPEQAQNPLAKKRYPYYFYYDDMTKLREAVKKYNSANSLEVYYKYSDDSSMPLGRGFYSVLKEWQGENNAKLRDMFVEQYLFDNPDWKSKQLPSVQRSVSFAPRVDYGRGMNYGMRGGDIRDNSFLPQSFYKLDGDVVTESTE